MTSRAQSPTELHSKLTDVDIPTELFDEVNKLLVDYYDIDRKRCAISVGLITQNLRRSCPHLIKLVETAYFRRIWLEEYRQSGWDIQEQFSIMTGGTALRFQHPDIVEKLQ